MAVALNECAVCVAPVLICIMAYKADKEFSKQDAKNEDDDEDGH